MSTHTNNTALMTILSFNELASTEYVKQDPSSLDQLLNDMTMGTPSIVQSAIDDLCSEYKTSTAAKRKLFSECLSIESRYLLLNYSFACSVASVRTSRADFCRKGLLALFVEGPGDDYRQIIVTLAVIRHSLILLDINWLCEVKEMINIFTGSTIAKVANGFLTRTDSEMEIDTFDICAIGEGVTFIYN